MAGIWSQILEQLVEKELQSNNSKRVIRDHQIVGSKSDLPFKEKWWNLCRIDVLIPHLSSFIKMETNSTHDFIKASYVKEINILYCVFSASICKKFNKYSSNFSFLHISLIM